MSGAATADVLSQTQGAAWQRGILVVNFKTGSMERRLMIKGVVDEFYDVAVLSRVRHPMALSVQTDEIAYTVRP